MGDAFMPLGEDFLDRIRPEDRFILAFPRSGSRWLRNVLTDLVNQWQGYDATGYYSQFGNSNSATASPNQFTGLKAQETLPDVYLPASQLSSAMVQLSGSAVYRSHHLTEVLRRSQGMKLYMLRHPAAMLVSYHAYSLQGGWISPEVTLKEFTSWKLQHWVDHVQEMLDYRRAHPSQCLFFLYQEPVPLTAPQIEAAASALGIPFTASAVQSALDRLRAFLENLNKDPQQLVQRGGNVNLLSRVPPELMEEILAVTEPLMREVTQVAVEP